MYERSHISVKVDSRSTSRLISTLYILPLVYLRDLNLRALTCVAKNASVEINIKRQKFFERNITKAVDINTMLIYFSDMKDVTGLPKKYTISHNIHFILKSSLKWLSNIRM